MVYTFIMIFLINANVNQCMATNWADDRNRQKFIPSNPHEIHIPMTDPWCCYIWCAMDPMGYELCMEYIPWVPSIYHRRYHDWGILLLYMVCHGYYQYTPVMLAYIYIYTSTMDHPILGKIMWINVTGFIQCGPPQWCLLVEITPVTMVISTINYSYWSYKPT